MVSYFSEQLADQSSRGLRNSVTHVKLEQGDLAEAWSEGVREYATVAMRFSMLDVTRDSGGPHRGRGRGDADHGDGTVDVHARPAAANGCCRPSSRLGKPFNDINGNGQGRRQDPAAFFLWGSWVSPPASPNFHVQYQWPVQSYEPHRGKDACPVATTRGSIGRMNAIIAKPDASLHTVTTTSYRAVFISDTHLGTKRLPHRFPDRFPRPACRATTCSWSVTSSMAGGCVSPGTGTPRTTGSSA